MIKLSTFNVLKIITLGNLVTSLLMRAPIHLLASHLGDCALLLLRLSQSCCLILPTLDSCFLRSAQVYSQ